MFTMSSYRVGKSPVVYFIQFRSWRRTSSLLCPVLQFEKAPCCLFTMLTSTVGELLMLIVPRSIALEVKGSSGLLRLVLELEKLELLVLSNRVGEGSSCLLFPITELEKSPVVY